MGSESQLVYVYIYIEMLVTFCPGGATACVQNGVSGSYMSSNL